MEAVFCISGCLRVGEECDFNRNHSICAFRGSLTLFIEFNTSHLSLTIFHRVFFLYFFKSIEHYFFKYYIKFQRVLLFLRESIIIKCFDSNRVLIYQLNKIYKVYLLSSVVHHHTRFNLLYSIQSLEYKNHSLVIEYLNNSSS